ncbi:hypothetical protein NDS46_18965 [Paenibacillus thiaminolyticus]|uniref:hypothetical protein n=1 Tax=Paenibacillus thiaminolyticus TaxID=49283 RepID=UPI00232FBE61|nr:hypothetical protein [Paenibacillus thiaminolyticus]WCF06428.1 hypothetical protein NDS46_18965 [Paenibacillus thiaminolyticus]
MNNIPMTQEVEMNESVSATLKNSIPLAQEPGSIMGFSSLMNNIPMTQEVEMNEAVSAPLKRSIPLAQEPGCIMGFFSYERYPHDGGSGDE